MWLRRFYSRFPMTFSFWVPHSRLSEYQIVAFFAAFLANAVCIVVSVCMHIVFTMLSMQYVCVLQVDYIQYVCMGYTILAYKSISFTLSALFHMRSPSTKTPILLQVLKLLQLALIDVKDCIGIVQTNLLNHRHIAYREQKTWPRLLIHYNRVETSQTQMLRNVCPCACECMHIRHPFITYIDLTQAHTAQAFFNRLFLLGNSNYQLISCLVVACMNVPLAVN